MQFLAQKQMLPTNIRVDMYCQPTWVTQNAIPSEQDPPPLEKVGLRLP